MQTRKTRFRRLTAKILARNIGKKVKVYEREIRNIFPRTTKDFDVKYTFTPSGDGELIKHRTKHILYPNWLRKRNYTVKKNDLFFIKGEMKSKNLEGEIQVAPLPTELVSSNLMNTEAFVKN